ncbi:PRC and DUF2382 domain-containing protein [Kitasatospora sp. YST-16]|uniref:PRC and DUF2382 domain-containing protein n=1 Tax=Kitasatospora sp. YST-16 TaxID=2998080 RepID=UPI0022848591|nr:PRC and DUF2382 domain-containing protein [Kitasatospora sp. YST-16]WAL70880.1 PRC and DUF2382 domain-containing protein [Kitasatospora sp. YST-16]WNW36916.1 PRC and DUF2382 domain-containing protein [Streptomyces sp. Li-HN-5-13]
MQTDIDPRDLIGHKAVDRNGDKIGTVDEVYLDDATGEPEWAAVRTGIFGRDAFVPLTTSEFSGEELRVPYDKSLIKESPDFGVGQHLSPAQELQLYRYYGLDTGADAGSGPAAKPAAAAAAAGTAGAAEAAKEHPRQEPASAPAAAAPDRDFGTVASSPSPTPAPTAAAAAFTTAKPQQAQQAQPQPHSQSQSQSQSQPAPVEPTAPVEITCREERIDVSTEWHVVGTTRLRKYVTTEQVERRVPVVRERVRVERIPVSDAERAALSEQEIAEAVEEVTLREERPVVRKYLAPIERVRLVVERYTEEEVVREELRREQVEVHDAAAGGDGEAPQQRQPWNAQPQSPTAGRPQASAANGSSEHARPEPLRS